jgi:tetratricopeptide (TPR) repeat protein
VRTHWLDLMLPPSAFLLTAGIYHQVFSLWHARQREQVQKHYQAALEAEEKQDRRTAVQELLAAARVAPDDDRLLMQIAADLHALDHPVPAAAIVERSLRHQKSASEGSYITLAGQWYEAGRYDDAERVLQQQVLPRWPDSALAAYMEGLIRVRRSKGEQGLRWAAHDFKRALEHAPRLLPARSEYAACLFHLGRLAEAEREFRTVLKANPAFKDAQRGLAAVLRQEGRLAGARKVLASSSRIEAAERHVRYLDAQPSRKETLAD